MSVKFNQEQVSAIKQKLANERSKFDEELIDKLSERDSYWQESLDKEMRQQEKLQATIEDLVAQRDAAERRASVPAKPGGPQRLSHTVHNPFEIGFWGALGVGCGIVAFYVLGLIGLVFTFMTLANIGASM